MSRKSRCFGICAVSLLLVAYSAAAQQGARDGQWRSYAAENGGTKYSALDQITAENVKDLKIAWRWKTLNLGPRPDYNFRATPLMVNGVLYTTAGTRRDVAAIDAATGETLWLYNPNESDRAGGGRSSSGRGVAYWTDGSDERIFVVTMEYRLIALNAKTGLPYADFGDGGAVDLKQGLGRDVVRGITSTSPPIVSNDVVVVGASLPIVLRSLETPPGHVRGFDPRTGERLWIFHTIPQPGDFGHETWENDSWKYTGNTGVWTTLTADDELGYVYLPVETATNDYYGGHRLGDNLFAESLVCLDIKTGKRVWHFQTVHHGIFDYDLPTHPILCDITVDGKAIKAVAQITKQGFVFVFDRITGEPVWPIEERAVAQSTIPGERSSPTQPFPTKPPPFEMQGVSLDDLIDFTPELRAEALEIASRYTLGPLYTPPTVLDKSEGGKKGVLNNPGTLGGANWPGGAFDPEHGILYVPSSTTPQLIALAKPDPARSKFDWVRTGSMSVPGPQGLPLVKPPWSRITAIDLNTGEHLWMVPNGQAPEHIRNHPALKGIDLSRAGNGSRGGPLVTKTLLFVGEGGGMYDAMKGTGGKMLRAYDKRTGIVISEFELPANQTGVPMTYMVNGKQYIVVAVGYRGHPAELVALTLSKK